MQKDHELENYYYVENSDIHGRGLFARVPIHEGSYMGTYSGPETEVNDTHVLWAETEDGIWIGRDGKNLLRYLNHSKDPSAEFDGFDLYAIRDIEEHEEITIDYGEDHPW